MIVTQLSGKFSIGDDGIFNLKRILEAASVTIKFPENGKIIGSVNGIPLTFIPTKERTFHDVEVEFFQSIKNSHLHIVHNRSFDKKGYVGKSTSIEIAYAIVRRKPILFIDNICLADHLPKEIGELITKNSDSFFYCDILTHCKSQIMKLLDSIPAEINYQCSLKDEIMVMSYVKDLLRGYH